MRRLAPAVGAVLVLGSLALFILLVVPDDEGRPAKSGQAARDDNLPAPVVQADALRLLQRAAAAPTTASYTGTQFVSAWSSQGATSQVLEVTHTPAAGTTWRSGGHATTTGSAVQTTSHTADPSILGGGAVTLLSSHYSLSTSGTSHVAGRAVDVVEARRPGAAAGRPPVARFWLDQATGLVLRREVYDGHGDPIRASAFIDVTVRAATTAGSGSGSGSDATATSAWSSTMDGAAVSRMRTHGWDCPESLPGPLPLVDARRGGEDQGIVHLSYADGIASISVFQQRGQARRHQAARLPPRGHDAVRRRLRRGAGRLGARRGPPPGRLVGRRKGLHRGGRRAGAYGGPSGGRPA